MVVEKSVTDYLMWIRMRGIFYLMCVFCQIDDTPLEILILKMKFRKTDFNFKKTKLFIIFSQKKLKKCKKSRFLNKM